MQVNKLVGWEKCYTGYSAFNVIVAENGDLIIEVTRTWDDLIFDGEHFDVVVEFENGGVNKPLVYVHEGQTELNQEEVDMIDTLIVTHLYKLSQESV